MLSKEYALTHLWSCYVIMQVSFFSPLSLDIADRNKLFHFRLTDSSRSNPANSQKIRVSKDFWSFIWLAGNFAIWTAGWILAVRVASSCIAWWIFPFNFSNADLRVTEAMKGPKVKICVFHHVCFVSRISRQNSSPESLAFPHLGNRAEISHMNPRRNSSRASLVNRDHRKRPWVRLRWNNCIAIAWKTVERMREN